MRDRHGNKLGGKGYRLVEGEKVYYNRYSNPRPCRMLDKVTGLPIKEFPSINKAVVFIRKNTKFVLATRDNIHNCCKGNRASAYGYSWEFIEKEEEE